MVTGDGWTTARAIAAQLGITDVHAEVLAWPRNPPFHAAGASFLGLPRLMPALLGTRSTPRSAARRCCLRARRSASERCRRAGSAAWPWSETASMTRVRLGRRSKASGRVEWASAAVISPGRAETHTSGHRAQAI